MSEKRERICPVCGRSYTDPPALSRRDNKTDICPECGMREALAAIPRRETPAERTPFGASSRGARPRSDDGRAHSERKDQQHEKDEEDQRLPRRQV